uniref:Uncharacterized protein n=1 Tax=Macaca mulatta TaxID=9544 RepID=A0A5F7ZKR1_MACMU
AGGSLEQCQRNAGAVSQVNKNNFEKLVERGGRQARIERRTAKTMPLHSSLGNKSKTLSQKKK